MKVSVLLKSFNYAPYLPAAIESALAQDATFPCEIVLSDDCSQDECPAIARGFADRFPEKIRLLQRGERLGMVRNTMETFLACRGEYVAWLDGDDYWTVPWKLRRQAAFLDAHREFVGCCTAVGVLRAGGHTEYPDPSEPRVISLEDLFHHSPIRTCTVMLRREAVRFPPQFAQLPVGDIPIFLLAARHGAFHYDPEVTAIYRQQGQVSATARLFAARDSWDRVQAELLERLRDSFDGPEFRLGLAGHYLAHVRQGLAGEVSPTLAARSLLRAIRSVPMASATVVLRRLAKSRT